MNQSGLSLEDSITLSKLGHYLKASEVLAKSPLSKQYCNAGAECLNQALKNGLKKAIDGLESAVENVENYIKLTEDYLGSSVVKEYLDAAVPLIDSDEWEEKNKPLLEYCLDFSEEALEARLTLHSTLKNGFKIEKIKQSTHEVKTFIGSEDVKNLKQFLENHSTTQPELTRDEIRQWGERIYKWGVKIDEIWQQVSELMEIFS